MLCTEKKPVKHQMDYLKSRKKTNNSNCFIVIMGKKKINKTQLNGV